MIARLVRVFILATAAMAAPAWAAPALVDPSTLDISNSGDTAFMLICGALVMLFALPGLLLIQAGRGTARAAQGVFLQGGAITALVSLLWVMVGYTLAFGDPGGGIIGGGNAWMLIALGNVRFGTAVPESAFVLFQIAGAMLAAMVVAGAWAGRARFGWALAFGGLWSLIVYAPVAHWIWGGGWLYGFGVLDYAGGIALHFCAGVSALVAAVVIGRRTGWPGAAAATHSPIMVLAGGMLLFAGNFALTGGWTLAATDDASSAIINAHVAACVSGLTWLLIEKLRTRTVTAMGLVNGLITGMAAIASASGLVSPGAAILIGLIAAPAGYFGLRFVTETLAIDDSNHAFALHGIGGLTGALLVAIFISESFGGVGYGEGSGMIGQLMAQLIGLAGVAMWSILATLIISYGIALAMPMRISPAEEAGEAIAPAYPQPAATDPSAIEMQPAAPKG
ncbi:ammonium transporter [Blastomonas natatoria]|uniref:Ammonium transporter n=1 Tax=Blastomonas natatoria TaxID=34015 RepID=A0A2V3UYV6_9SPHN|nr:ammonium transporter [Blastomonas natatoria]PXW74527.1 ammonium transporter [Blastomonas natatoria]